MLSASIPSKPKSNILKSTYLYIMPTVTIEAFQCTRCGHVWAPRGGILVGAVTEDEKPKVCPRCKSPYWDRPRRRPVDSSRRNA